MAYVLHQRTRLPYFCGLSSEREYSKAHIREGILLASHCQFHRVQDNRMIVAEIEKQFSRLDEAVANLKRVKANLKRYKAAVLKAAIEGKLTEDWRNKHPNVEPASKLLERILAERRAKWKEGEITKNLPRRTPLAFPLLPEQLEVVRV